MAKKVDETFHMQLRLPGGLRKQIERAAAKNARSMNSEIIYLLQQALQFGDLETVTGKAVEGAARLAVLEILERLDRAEKRAGASLSVGSSDFYEALIKSKDESK